jgi:hypothetical protein
LTKIKGAKKGYPPEDAFARCKNERQKGINERNERKGRIRRIRLESNLEKKKRRYNSKVRGKTEGEIGKVSAEKGDTLVIPRRFSRQWVVEGTARVHGVLLSTASGVNKIQDTKQYHPGNWS